VKLRLAIRDRLYLEKTLLGDDSDTIVVLVESPLELCVVDVLPRLRREGVRDCILAYNLRQINKMHNAIHIIHIKLSVSIATAHGLCADERDFEAENGALDDLVHGRESVGLCD